jgi:predicted GNAT family N-acyltransferase
VSNGLNGHRIIEMLKKLEIDEWREYIDLREQLSGYRIELSKTEFIQKYESMLNQGSVIYMYHKNNRIVGTIKIFIELKICDSVGRLEDVVVNERDRCLGIGTDMIKQAIDMLREQGCYKILVSTRKELERFYTNLGLKVTGVEIELSMN